MTNILKFLYELFGYSKGMSNMLMRIGSDCVPSGASQYPVMFYGILISVVIFYLFHYHFLNSASFNKKSSCWVMGLFLALANFVIGFVWTRDLAATADYCRDEGVAGQQDFILFGLASATISFIIWAILTSSPVPRRFAGVNMNQTTLWKP